LLQVAVIEYGTESFEFDVVPVLVSLLSTHPEAPRGEEETAGTLIIRIGQIRADSPASSIRALVFLFSTRRPHGAALDFERRAAQLPLYF